MEPVAFVAGGVFGGLLLAVVAVSWIVRSWVARSPWVYGQFQDVVAKMSDENQELRAELAASDETARQLRRELTQTEARLDRLETYVEAQAAHIDLLSERLRTLGALDIPPAPQPPKQDAPARTPRPASVWSDARAIKLARGIATLFNLEEIDGLAFEIGLANDVVGNTPAARARSLVSTASHHPGSLDQLIELCRQERPNGGFE